MTEVIHVEEPKCLEEAQGDDRWMEAMQSLGPCGPTTKMQSNQHQVGVQDQIQVQWHVGKV